MLAVTQDVASVAAVRVFQNARSPMAGRNMSHGESGVAEAAPPVEFDHIAESQVRDQIEDVMGNHDGGAPSTAAIGLLGNRAQRRPVKMIKMRVRNQCQVD